MAEILEPSAATLAFLARQLAAGELVAMPTETVYGLAADARSDAAIAAVFEAKGRPSANPLIAHYPDVASAARDVVLDARAHALAAEFWPGPLTLVARRSPDCRVARRASAGRATLAVRCPDHDVARGLLKACGFPLVAPSANPSGELSPVTAQHVEQRMGDRIRWILEGGQTRRGVESTIVDLTATPAEILRFGTITRAAIEAVIGPVVTPNSSENSPRAPGMAFRHYAPACPLILDLSGPRIAGEALLTFGDQPVPEGFSCVVNLSASGDLLEAAAGLFAALHELEAKGATRIAVASIPDEGVGVAINDRLRRAAAASVSR